MVGVDPELRFGNSSCPSSAMTTDSSSSGSQESGAAGATRRESMRFGGRVGVPSRAKMSLS